MREESRRGRGRIRVSLRMEAAPEGVGRGILRLRILRSRMLILRGRFRNVLLIIVREGIAILLIFRYVFLFPFLVSSGRHRLPSFPFFSFHFPPKEREKEKKKKKSLTHPHRSPPCTGAAPTEPSKATASPPSNVPPQHHAATSTSSTTTFMLSINISNPQTRTCANKS